MLIQELKVGIPISLHIRWGGVEYEIASKVEFVNKDSIIVHSYTYGGQTVNFASASFKDACVDVYVDNYGGKRYCWMNIDLKVVTLFNKDFYEIKVNAFKKNGEEKDRRGDDRIDLSGQDGIIRDCKTGESWQVSLKDVSQAGIAFYSDQPVSTPGGLYEVNYIDYVRDRQFDVKFVVKPVRTGFTKDRTILYGCAMVEARNDSLGYLYLKAAAR